MSVRHIALATTRVEPRDSGLMKFEVTPGGGNKAGNWTSRLKTDNRSIITLSEALNLLTSHGGEHPTTSGSQEQSASKSHDLGYIQRLELCHW